MRGIWIIAITAFLGTGCQQAAKKTTVNTLEGDSIFIKASDASIAGNINELQQLLTQHPYVANARDSRKFNNQEYPRSLLHILAQTPAHRINRTETALLLINAGCEVNGRLFYSHGETPLHWAASSGDVQLIKLLLDNGADVDAVGGTINNGTPLVNALYFGNTISANVLVNRGASIFNFALAAGLGREDLMREYVKYGGLAPAAARNKPNGSVPDKISKHKISTIYQQSFIYAVFNHQFKIADQLITSGAHVNYQWGVNNYSMLHHVAERGSKDMAKYLLKNGADVNNSQTTDNLTPLQVALNNNNARVENVIKQYMN